MDLRQRTIATIIFLTSFSYNACTEKTTVSTALRTVLNSVTTEMPHSVTEFTLINPPIPDLPELITLPIEFHTKVLMPKITLPTNSTQTPLTETPTLISDIPGNSVTQKLFSVQTLRSEVHSVTPPPVLTTTPELHLETMILTIKPHIPDVVLSGLVDMRPKWPELIEPEKTPESLVENVTKISGVITEKHLTPDKIYGNRKDTNSAFKYVFPVVIGICMLTTLVLVYFLTQRLRKANSQMNKASCLLLIVVALMDLLTMCFALAEISFLFHATQVNNGFIPPGKCREMFILERLSAIPHAASTWVTVVLAIQRFYCVSKPFSASKNITVRSSYILSASVSAFAIILHMCRFLDKNFVSVTFNINNLTIVSCHGNHSDWISNPILYESVFAWTRISVAQFIPGSLMVTFVTLMIRSLRKTSKATKHMKLADSNLQSDRRQLSIFVAIVAIVVFCVEISSGIFLSLNAWEKSTGHEIVSYKTLKNATIPFDLVLYVSYFAIFLLYCMMSKDIRRAMKSVWCVRQCQTLQLSCSSDQEPVSKKSTTLTLLPLQDGPSSANQSPVLVEKLSKN